MRAYDAQLPDRELPVMLVKARVARGWTQGQLAEKLGVPEEQVHRWERQDYHGVTLESLSNAADALGVKVQGHFATASK
ncbi:MAG TPA: helix-turn-helix transcriptional regulator [Coriobacteriia bacterium]|nr:helix-turn-helix transcriptional regulator [Coriobacteriia bacterium]